MSKSPYIKLRDLIIPTVWMSDDPDFREGINRSARNTFFRRHPRLLMGWFGVLCLTVGVIRPDYLLNMIAGVIVDNVDRVSR